MADRLRLPVRIAEQVAAAFVFVFVVALLAPVPSGPCPCSFSDDTPARITFGVFAAGILASAVALYLFDGLFRGGYRG